MSAPDVGGVNAGLGGKGGDQAVVGGQVFEHAGKETGFARRSANLGRAYAGHGKEAPKPLAVAGDEGKRLNCKRFCSIWRQPRGLLPWSNLPFVNISRLP